ASPWTASQETRQICRFSPGSGHGVRHALRRSFRERSMRATVLLCALLSAATAGVGHAQILAQIEPTEAALTAQSDGSARGTWTIRNLGRDPARVRMRLADLRIGDGGSAQMSPAGTTLATLQGYVRISPAEFGLPAGEAMVVRLAGSLPDTGAA